MFTPQPPDQIKLFVALFRQTVKLKQIYPVLFLWVEVEGLGLGAAACTSMYCPCAYAGQPAIDSTGL